MSNDVLPIIRWDQAYNRNGDSKLPRAVVNAIRTYVDNRTLSGWVKAETLAEDTGMTVRGVRKQIAANVAAGWLEISEPGNSARATVYRLTYPDREPQFTVHPEGEPQFTLNREPQFTVRGLETVNHSSPFDQTVNHSSPLTVNHSSRSDPSTVNHSSPFDQTVNHSSPLTVNHSSRSDPSTVNHSSRSTPEGCPTVHGKGEPQFTPTTPRTSPKEKFSTTPKTVNHSSPFGEPCITDSEDLVETASYGRSLTMESKEATATDVADGQVHPPIVNEGAAEAPEENRPDGLRTLLEAAWSSDGSEPYAGYGGALNRPTVSEAIPDPFAEVANDGGSDTPPVRDWVGVGTDPETDGPDFSQSRPSNRRQPPWI